MHTMANKTSKLYIEQSIINKKTWNLKLKEIEKKKIKLALKYYYFFSSSIKNIININDIKK